MTVPVAAAPSAPGTPVAPPVLPAPLFPNSDAKDDAALDEVDDVPWLRWRAAPPQMPPAAIKRATKATVGTDSRMPLRGPRSGHSSSSVVLVSHGSSPDPAGAVSMAEWPSLRATKSSSVGGSSSVATGELMDVSDSDMDGRLSVLLVAQGVDGPQRRGAVGGVEAEENTHGDGDAEGQSDRCRRHDWLDPVDLES